MVRTATVLLASLCVMGIAPQGRAAKPAPSHAPRPTPKPIERTTGCISQTTDVKPFASLVAVPSYPPVTTGQTEYTIPAEDTCAHLALLSLPAGFTLKVAPGIRTIQWQVDQIQFGPGATFDLSASQVKPPKPPTPAQPSQAGYCDRGKDGTNATPGQNGGDAVNLLISGVQAITNSTGGLWVRNDGGPGQDSGNSGNGGYGGGHEGGPFGCDKMDGGRAGVVAYPGRGGHVSVVSITALPGLIGKKPVKVEQASSGPSACGPSTRPPGAVTNTGAIVVLGQPGCAGNQGSRGIDRR